jgi:hypothetical protein
MPFLRRCLPITGVVVGVVTAMTFPLHAAEIAAGETTAIAVLDSHRPAGVDLSTRAPLLATSQLQPTKLKKISTKKAIILTAVVVAAVVVITYAIAISGFRPVFTSSSDGDNR